MKFILPFDVNEIFTLEDHSLLQSMCLTVEDLLNQALCRYAIYAEAELTDKYEVTIDDLVEAIASLGLDSEQSELMELELAKNADRLVELIDLSAGILHRGLQNIPQQLARVNEEEYISLEVTKVNERGRFVEVSSRVTGGLKFAPSFGGWNFAPSFMTKSSL